MSKVPTSRARSLAAGLVTAGVLLGGCGIPEKLVGITPAPSAAADGAPLDADSASAIVARVLADADAAAARKGSAGEKARKAALTGDALAVAEAAGSQAGTPAVLSAPEPPAVIAISSGRAWPRAILASTLDADGTKAHLHVLVSTSAASPFKLAASTTMLPGAALPGAGETQAGAAFFTGSTAKDSPAIKGLALAPASAAAAYAAALAVPAPKDSKGVSVKDSFATSLRAATSAQKKALGKLATVTQKHVANPNTLVGFRLADGSAVVLTRLTRVDTITVGAQTKEIVLPAEYARLTGKKKATKKVALTWMEPVILVIPPKGSVSAIGAEELLVKGSAS